MARNPLKFGAAIGILVGAAAALGISAGLAFLRILDSQHEDDDADREAEDPSVLPVERD